VSFGLKWIARYVKIDRRGCHNLLIFQELHDASTLLVADFVSASLLNILDNVWLQKDDFNSVSLVATNPRLNGKSRIKSCDLFHGGV